MPRIINLEGQTFGIWKVICRTNEKNKNNGSILYKCLNTKTNKTSLKDAGYLKQFKARNSKNATTRGRPRKWIIIKKPYIEEKEA